MRHLLQRRDADGGFTLVELLVAMAVFSVVAAATTSLVISQHRAYQFTEDLRIAMDEARTALDRVQGQLRGACEVRNTSTAAQLDFMWDADDDGACDDPTSYRIDADGVLRRSADGGLSWMPVARQLDVDRSTFTYDPDVSSWWPTRTVKLAFVMDAAPQDVTGREQPAVVEVRLRNGN